MAAPLLLVLALAAYPLFAFLGQPALWEDEGDTAVFASSIVRSGLPLAWDGRTFSDCDFGRRVVPFGESNFLMVGTPWLSFYATAASFAVLGETRTAARLPFALAGLATLALLYHLVLVATGDRRAALASALLLLCSTQFLLYARESRHYALNMLLTLAVLVAFLRLRERPRSWAFAASAVALFHAQILPALVCVGACGALALAHPAFRAARAPFLRSLPWVALGTAPWLLLSWRETGTNWSPLAAVELPVRFGQLALESQVAIPWLGWAVGIPLVWRRFGPRDREWLATAGAVVAAAFVLAPLALSPTLLGMLGLRYVCGLLPLAAGVSGLLVARASGGSRAGLAAGIALFGLTHLAGSALPALVLGESGPLGRTGLHANVQRGTAGKLLNLELWALLRGLGRPDPGTSAVIAAWLRAHARPGEVLVTNYSWDNLYFETRLPQGLLLPPGTPGHDAGRSAGLPDYVFGVDRADWVVWRHGLAPSPGYSFERVRDELAARGARLERRASFKETQWENRPELAWHRFPRVGYPFAPARLGAAGVRYPDAVAYRVVWP